jgi:peptide/nickel transport system permease protein
MMILLISVQLGWLPPSGYVPLTEDWRQSLATTIMPAFVLGNAIAAVLMRHTRSAMLTSLDQDYVRTARAKGLSQTSIILKHALRNALVPIVALSAVQLGLLLGGSVVIETIFALDGAGFLAYQSITHKDLPVTQALLTLLSILYVGLILIADIANAWLDPRIRVG